MFSEEYLNTLFFRKSQEEIEDKILSTENSFSKSKSVESVNSLVKENSHKRKNENLTNKKNNKKRVKRLSLEKLDEDFKNDKLRKKVHTFVPHKSTSEINNTNHKGETRLHKLCSLVRIIVKSCDYIFKSDCILYKHF